MKETNAVLPSAAIAPGVLDAANSGTPATPAGSEESAVSGSSSVDGGATRRPHKLAADSHTITKLPPAKLACGRALAAALVVTAKSAADSVPVRPTLRAWICEPARPSFQATRNAPRPNATDGCVWSAFIAAASELIAPIVLAAPLVVTKVAPMSWSAPAGCS